MANYTIEEELDFLFNQSKSDTFALIDAKEIHEAMSRGKFQGINFFPQYADYLGNASFYGFLADLEPSRALALAHRTSKHFGEGLDSATAIEELTASVAVGETPATSEALLRLDRALLPYLVQHEAVAAEQAELTARAQPQGRVEVYRSPGRPTLYPGRKRTTIELSYELLDALDALRGNQGMGAFIEEVLRRDPRIAATLEESRRGTSH